jgi:cytochrome oxidase Cu insertion factor (SCO1/SenC/PrrC family)
VILHRVVNPAEAARAVPIGKQVRDVIFSDQTEKPTRLTSFKGKVGVLTFTYARCPNPNLLPLCHA